MQVLRRFADSNLQGGDGAMIRSLTLCVLLFPFTLTYGQQEVITFSGRFSGASFAEFADAVENQTGVSFYFLPEWVDHIQINVSGTAIPLLPTLDSILTKNGVCYLLDEWNHLFITGNESVVQRLPWYDFPNDRVENEPAAEGERKEQGTVTEGLTTTEQKYINGRQQRVLEVIHVGSGEADQEGPAVIQGKIGDAESGEPVTGATVYIAELKKGTSTNSEGLFRMVLPTGTHQVVCNSMGMEPLQFNLVVHSTGALSLSMHRTLIPLDEVVVMADRYHHVRGTRMGFEQLNYAVFKDVPLVLGERDILNILKLLPGVQSVGEGSAGYNVRGSGADQNMIHINKVPVYNSTHLFGFFTSFSPLIVSDFSLYKSHMPASFGGRLASFLDIHTKQGNMKTFGFKGGISSVSAYAAVEGPVVRNRSSFILSGRSTYSDWILKRMPDPVLRNSEAGFYDLSGGYTHELGENTRLKVFGYGSNDRFKFGEYQTYSYGNAGASADLHHRFNERLAGNLVLVFSNYRFSSTDIQVASQGYEHGYRVQHHELRSDFSWLPGENHAVTFGFSGIYYHLNRGVVMPYGANSIRSPLDLGKENGVEAAGYISDVITISDRITAEAGIRISGFFSLGPSEYSIYQPGMPRQEGNIVDTLLIGRAQVSRTYGGVGPRLMMRYLVGNNSSVKISYNRIYQYLFMLTNTYAIAPTDQWKLCDYHIGPQYQDQISTGYYHDFQGTGMSTSIELYRKWGHHLVEYRDGASFMENPHVEREILPGELGAYGMELMVRKDAGVLQGWLSYNYSRSKMRVNVPATDEQLNNGNPYPSNFDRPHNFTLVTQIKRGRRISFSSNLVYMTGRPVTYPVSLYYQYDIPYIHYSDRNKYRIPDYFRIDLSMNIEGNLKRKKLFHSFWMINVYNLTGRKNAYSVYFRNVNGYVKGYKLSVFGQPIVTVSWNVKLGNYATE